MLIYFDQFSSSVILCHAIFLVVGLLKYCFFPGTVDLSLWTIIRPDLLQIPLHAVHSEKLQVLDSEERGHLRTTCDELVRTFHPRHCRGPDKLPEDYTLTNNLA